MQKKIDLPKLWRYWTLAFLAVCWIVVVHYLRYSFFWVLLLVLVYLLINVVVFRSYFYGMIGAYLLYTRRNEKAFVFFEHAVKKNTRNINALYHWGLKLLQDGNAEEALETFNRALKINTKVMMDKNIRLATGSCYWILNDIEKAIETLEDLKESYSYVNPSVLTTLGYLHFLNNDLEKARQYTNDAIKDNPSQASAWDNLGQIALKEKDRTSAKEHFLKTLEFKADMPDSLYYLGEISQSEGDFEAARTYYEKALNCNITSLNTISKDDIENKLLEIKTH